MTASANEEEMRKRLTARLTSAPSHLLLDNLTHRIEGASLSALLTTDDTWTDRVLGLSRDIDLPVRCALIATGNNLQANDELARRMISCRLDAGVDRPEERSDWRHPNLLAWVRAQRAEIVAAVLTFARAWHLARRPYNGLTLGRYEQWAHVVGGILEVAEIDGFLANQHDFYERADRYSTLWREFVEAWWERHGREPVDVHTLWMLADDWLDLRPGDPDKRRAKLGYQLRARRDQSRQPARREGHDERRSRALGAERGDPVMVAMTVASEKAWPPRAKPVGSGIAASLVAMVAINP